MLFAQKTLAIWHDTEPHGAALNMALDEALLRVVQGPVLRFYRWAEPAVTFGYFGQHAEVLREWPGREAIRRWTGGGVVPHGEDLTYSLLVPREHPVARLNATECYRVIHAAVAEALGEGTTLAARKVEAVSTACFENPAESDVLLGDRKIAGAAQRRTRHGLLHQGSVQSGAGLDFTQKLERALCDEARSFRPDAGVWSWAETLVAQKYGTDEWLRRF